MTGSGASTDWDVALRDALDEFGCGAGTIHLLEPSGDALVLVAKVRIPDTLMSAVGRVPIGKGMAGLAAQRNAPVDSCDIRTDTSGDVRPAARETGVQGALAVPMRDPGGRVRGVLGVGAHQERIWTEEETNRLMALGTSLIASAAGDGPAS